ncbi:TPA: dihydrofolate reductase [Candidatus Gracilibacteria bacterium]|nr:dihydrofolate reductase [Candidatus Gracilibacteria bacterium]
MYSKKPTYILIAAMADNRVIGNKGQLPWHLPEDLQNFKRLTTGGVIIMGRKTYESIGRPLPNRRNIVLSSQGIEKEGIEAFPTIPEMLGVLENEGIDKVFIIGGQKIYEEFLKMQLVDEVWLSKIPGHYEGDVFLAEFEKNFEKQKVEQFETFQFIRYRKKEHI